MKATKLQSRLDDVCGVSPVGGARLFYNDEVQIVSKFFTLEEVPGMGDYVLLAALSANTGRHWTHAVRKARWSEDGSLTLELIEGRTAVVRPLGSGVSDEVRALIEADTRTRYAPLERVLTMIGNNPSMANPLSW